MSSRFGPLFVRPGDSDLETLWQTLGAREYDLRRYPQNATILAAYQAMLAAGKTPLVIDAGANVGGASIWFSTQFPEAKIFAIEPDPSSAELCRLNTRNRNVEVVEAAIGACGGFVSLTASDASWGVRTVRGGSVPIITVAEIKNRHPNSELLLAKIDIEGFEGDLFADSTQWLNEVVAVIIEPHDWMLPGQKSSAAFRAALGPEFDMLIAGENLAFVRN